MNNATMLFYAVTLPCFYLIVLIENGETLSRIQTIVADKVISAELVTQNSTEVVD